MSRSIIAICAALLLCGIASAQTLPASDPTAVALAVKSLKALTGGSALQDVTVNANVISVFGSDYQTGTAVFQAKGLAESRVDFNLNGATRSEVHNATNGFPSGAWSLNGGAPTALPQQNCWTDAAWFFPALGTLSRNSASRFVFTYLGLVQYEGLSVQHISVFQVPSFMTDLATAQKLTTMDFYLDPNTYLPLIIAARTHLDADLNTDILAETSFANYQTVSGIQVPFHIQRSLNGTVVFDATATSVVFNSGLLDSTFTLQ